MKTFSWVNDWSYKLNGTNTPTVQLPTSVEPKRVSRLPKHPLPNNETQSSAASRLGISKSTLHKRLSARLPIDAALDRSISKWGGKSTTQWANDLGVKLHVASRFVRLLFLVHDGVLSEKQSTGKCLCCKRDVHSVVTMVVFHKLDKSGVTLGRSTLALCLSHLAQQAVVWSRCGVRGGSWRFARVDTENVSNDKEKFFLGFV